MVIFTLTFTFTFPLSISFSVSMSVFISFSFTTATPIACSFTTVSVTMFGSAFFRQNFTPQITGSCATFPLPLAILLYHSVHLTISVGHCLFFGAGGQLLQTADLALQHLPQRILAVLAPVLLLKGDSAPYQLIRQKLGAEHASPRTLPTAAKVGDMLDAAAPANWAARTAGQMDSSMARFPAKKAEINEGQRKGSYYMKIKNILFIYDRDWYRLL